MTEKMTYAGTGVDYDAIDPFKRAAQVVARETAKNIERFDCREVEESRGESVYLVEFPDFYLAHVEEGLGTKNLVADEMYRLTGESYDNRVSQCTVATIVNDMITSGASPISCAMHIAAANSQWFNNEKRTQNLIRGWKRGCDLARCAWGGGETPTLKGIVVPGTALLSGSAVGIIQPKSRRIMGNIQHGDAIILIESSEIHANGLTLAREIAEKLPEGYLTKLPDGRTYGETLLDPTHIYVSVIEECLKQRVDVHYAINITGHGWRKLMRAKNSFTYVIEQLPQQLLIFDFIRKYGPVDIQEAYGNLNMGAGFALYVQERGAWETLEIIKSCGFSAILAGHIEKSKDKKVLIKPVGIEFLGNTLEIR